MRAIIRLCRHGPLDYWASQCVEGFLYDAGERVAHHREARVRDGLRRGMSLAHYQGKNVFLSHYREYVESIPDPFDATDFRNDIVIVGALPWVREMIDRLYDRAARSGTARSP